MKNESVTYLVILGDTFDSHKLGIGVERNLLNPYKLLFDIIEVHLKLQSERRESARRLLVFYVVFGLLQCGC